MDEYLNLLISQKISPFYITLKDIGFFPDVKYIRVIWIGIEEKQPLKELFFLIEKELIKLNFKKEKKFIPHVTIARVKSKIPKDIVEKIKNTKLILEDTIEKITLYKSTPTPSGSIYEVIETYKL